METYIQLFFVWLFLYIVVRIILTRKQNKTCCPPSPPALPIIGHLHLISKLPHQSIHNLSTRYGPIMQLFLGSVPCVVVSNPEIAKEFLKTHEASFPNHSRNPAVQYLYGSMGIIFAPYGEHLKFVKKLCMSEILSGRTLDRLLSMRQQETLRFLRLMQKKGEADEAVNIGGEVLTLANNILTRTAMGRTFSKNHGDVEDIKKMVLDTSVLLGKFNVSDFFGFRKIFDLQGRNKRLKEIRSRFDAMMERVIREHEEEKKQSKEKGDSVQNRDFLSILMETRENESTNIKLTRESIKAFIMDIFIAGTDTSAMTIEWALAELINHPRVMKKARQEIDLVTGKTRLIEESDLPNLTYLQAIVKESLRLHPPIPIIGRKSIESCNVCGYDIPPKSLLFVNLWSMGRDPNLWESPLEFKPERFMTEEKQLDVRGQNFQLIPFGTGRRVCPGASLALQVVPTNLAAMVQCFEWKVDETVNMEEKPALSLPRAHPLICVPVPRFNCIPPSAQY